MNINTQNTKYYEMASTVKEYTKFSPIFPEEKKIFEKYQKSIKGKAVLDIGCGAGRTTETLKNMATDYTGIDYSEKMIDACKRKFKVLKFIHCDASDMRVLGKKKYDFILFSFNGLDSMSHDKRIKTLQEIYRCLKKDGVFAFSTHNRDFKRKVSLYDLFGINIIRNIRYICTYITVRKQQSHCETYEILSDPFSDYGHLTYYIRKSDQVKQLEDNGFRCIEILNRECQSTRIETPERDSNFFYYICKKLQL